MTDLTEYRVEREREEKQVSSNQGVGIGLGRVGQGRAALGFCNFY
jgi:hypothetical protein